MVSKKSDVYNNVLKVFLLVVSSLLILFVSIEYGIKDLFSSTFLLIVPSTIAFIIFIIISTYTERFKGFIQWIFGEYNGKDEKKEVHSKFIDVMRTFASSFIFGMAILVAFTSSGLTATADWSQFHLKVIFFSIFFILIFVGLFATIGYEIKR